MREIELIVRLEIIFTGGNGHPGNPAAALEPPPHLCKRRKEFPSILCGGSAVISTKDYKSESF